MSKFSVLIVDDVQDNIYSLKLIIEDNFDVDIYSALSATEAMELLMKTKVDLILSDIQMPDIDGFQFAQYLKSVDSTKNIPIIFITGIYDKDAYQKKGYEIGAVEYISKPIDENLLTAKLKVYIDLFEDKKRDTSELSKKEEILIHQSKMATMGEMIGVIAHQLKQPLNNMSLYCSDVKDSYKHGEIDDNFIEEFDKNTKDQIVFMSETINDFMNFFNPNKTKKSFTIKSAMDKTIKLLDKQLVNNNIDLKVHLGEETAFGVETELEQVFLNLITNAKDAFVERQIQKRQIAITSMTRDKYSIVIIEDNAGGIKEDNLDKIFDPYYTTKDYGTGTGLYMVKLVIKSSFGGDLKIQNGKHGAKFIIVVPKSKP